MDLNRAIPNAVKQRLRQEAGFGCSECGHPFIEYHHIIPFAAHPHHRAEDMMVLCPNHHHLCTTGALTESEQRSLKRRPRNVVDNLTRGILYTSSTTLEVELAGGRAINTPRLLTFRGEDILSARLSEDSRLLISAVIQDPAGDTVARLIENEWFLVPSAVWDFEVGPRRAIVRSAAREIAFQIDCRDKVQLRGAWFLGGMRITFGPSGASIGNMNLGAMTVRNSGGYIGID